jgi:polyisoprenoid-binding protein YceI
VQLFLRGYVLFLQEHFVYQLTTMTRISLAAVLFLLFSLTAFGQTNWKTTEYNVSFKIKNAGITVSGKFEGFKGQLLFSPDKLATSALSASVEVATIKTGIAMRDNDLQAEKYFNSAKYPLIEVKSTKLYKKDARYAGLFNVTIKGVTRQVEIPFDYLETGNEATFTGSFPLKRSDFGIGGKTLTMSDDLTVSIMVKAKK